MSSRCFDVVRVGLLLVVLSFEVESSTKSTPVCPVRPTADESGPRGECHCSVLSEIQCRGLSAVPEIDLNASYVGRQTYRSLYLASQHIRRLPAAAFAALNVRRIVLDFNPLGDRINPRTFRGTVDAVELARLGLVSRRRRTSDVTGDLVASSRLRHFNASKNESRQPEAAAADEKRTFSGNRHRHKQTAAGRGLDFNASDIYDEIGRGQVEIPVIDKSRRYH